MDHKSLLSVMRLHGRCYNYHSLFHFLNDIMSLFYRTFLRVSLKTLTRFLEDFISSALPILYVFSCSLHLENDLGAFLFCLLAFLLAGFLYLLLALNISLSSCKKKKILQKLRMWSLLWNPKSPPCSWPSRISSQSQSASLSSRLPCQPGADCGKDLCCKFHPLLLQAWVPSINQQCWF